MDDQNKNLILATALSFLVILVWFILFPPPTAPVEQTPVEQLATLPQAPQAEIAAQTAAPLTQAAPRVKIDTPELAGSISLIGGRIDDLSLKSYRETLDPQSDLVRLFTPTGQDSAYYALYGYAPAGDLAADAVPGPNTQWTLSQGVQLTPTSPVTLTWDNGAGLQFTRVISVDEKLMFQITQRVENVGAVPARMQPYGLVARH